MMTIAPALDEDVRFVAANMRAKDVEEFLALTHAPDRRALQDSLLDRYGGHPLMVAAKAGDVPVAVGGAVELRPNVATLVMFATERFPDVAFGLTRFVVQNLFARYRGAGVHRIEAVSMEGHTAAHRWIRALGLHREAVLPGYGRGGETFLQFAWVAEHVRSPGA